MTQSVPSTKFYVVPDVHACSFNRVKEVCIVQNGAIVVLDQFDIENIQKLLKESQ